MSWCSRATESRRKSPSSWLAKRIHFPEFEAEAIARPDVIINPVDLGTILVPSGWLLLGPGQSATLETAAISRTQNWPRPASRHGSSRLPPRRARLSIPLHAGVRADRPAATAPGSPRHATAMSFRSQSTTATATSSGTRTSPSCWCANRRAGRASAPAYEKLRFDAPISVRDPATGKYSSLRYRRRLEADRSATSSSGCPTGRGSSSGGARATSRSGPAGNNTGACYEWAEIISQPQGAVDCVEPLMDKELRYGRVEIVEATSAQVHVRWTYQSTDFKYKVWGDEAVEDYYFYPDGFGTRVVSLKADPKNDYELSEFIILTPAGAYPFDVLPEHAVDALFLDGRKHEFRFPNPTTPRPGGEGGRQEGRPGDLPPAVRQERGARGDLFQPQRDPAAAGRLRAVLRRRPDGHALLLGKPLAAGAGKLDREQDRRPHRSSRPCHNSVMSWAGMPSRADPIGHGADARHPGPIAAHDRAALGVADRHDRRDRRQLRDRAKSFATPPDLELRGARPDFAGYVIERRAMRLEATSRDVQITIKPTAPCVNPVFEFAHAPRGQIKVTLAGQPLDCQTLCLGRPHALAGCARSARPPCFEITLRVAPASIPALE